MYIYIDVVVAWLLHSDPINEAKLWFFCVFNNLLLKFKEMRYFFQSLLFVHLLIIK
jgi:hypothetical protein